MERSTKEIRTDHRVGILADMHTHSRHSHDSTCPIEEMAKAQKKRGTTIFAVTDHCDMEAVSTDIKALVNESVNDTEYTRSLVDGIEILRGIEIGEGFWNRERMREILSMREYDVVIGSVHAVRYEGYTGPYSRLDFSQLGKEKTLAYLDCYFDDLLYMVETTELDVLAHLTCPLRYINGKYGMNIDCHVYKEKITAVLAAVIRHGIVLEINTSCKGSRYDAFMPEEWILSLYRELGGTLISLGSDAHIGANASHAFDAALEMLKRNGYHTLCYLKNRCIYQYELKKCPDRSASDAECFLRRTL